MSNQQLTSWNEWEEAESLPFDFNIETTRWDFEDGSYLTLEKNDCGYLFGGRVDGKDVHDDDWEDFYFATTDELLSFFEKHKLIKLLSRKET